MPFEASHAQSPEAPQGAQRPRRHHRHHRPALTLGVFRHDGEWKIYSSFERAVAYPNRDLAVQVAETRALEAARRGVRVELFIQDENGELRQAALELR
ncbi:MAG: hypothetical protein JWO72_1704 [Caulobacteraceae bacterium]|jgi:hypothetical protein|nr:hypothetical protein [Caulobacteraceae bacterium]